MGAPRPDVVVLAAGRSSRMGEPKGLVCVRGRPWLELQLEAIERAGGRAVVVLGFDLARYQQALPDLGARGREALVVNPDPARGPFSSLQCGLASLRPAGGAGPDRAVSAFVLPVDVPAPGPPVWSALALALPGHEAAVPELEGRGGHPVLLGPDLVARLLRAPAGGRLDAALASARTVRVPVTDARVRLNLNRPEDWSLMAR